MGQGLQQIIRGGEKGRDNEAEVTGQALHVRVVSGGGGGGPSSDVNIAAVGGVAIGPTVPVSGTVSVVEPVSVDDNGGSLTVDGIVDVGTITNPVVISSITNPVTIAEPVSVDDNGGSLTVDGTVAVSGVAGTVTVAGTVNVGTVAGTVTVAEPVSVDDNGGSLTVDDGGGSLTVDFTQPVSTITPYARDAVAGADHFVWPSGVVRRDTLVTITPVVGDYTGALCNSRGATWVTTDGTTTVTTAQLESATVVGGHAVFPAGAVVDSTLANITASNLEWTDLRTDAAGALWVTPSGTVDVAVTNVGPLRTSALLHNAQVFNNVTTTANGASLDVASNSGRTILVYYDIAVANAPTSIRLVPQFSLDGGTVWFDYSVDQWVDMRFVPGQMPLKECCPLNYVVGPLFRVRIDAVGTTATATFTVTLRAECAS